MVTFTTKSSTELGFLQRPANRLSRPIMRDTQGSDAQANVIDHYGSGHISCMIAS